MGMTLAEKIIAKAAGRDVVSPGEIVTCAVDLAMIHDSGGPRRVKPILDRLGLKATCVGHALLNVPPAAVYKITRRGPSRLQHPPRTSVDDAVARGAGLRQMGEALT